MAGLMVWISGVGACPGIAFVATPAWLGGAAYGAATFVAAAARCCSVDGALIICPSNWLIR